MAASTCAFSCPVRSSSRSRRTQANGLGLRLLEELLPTRQQRLQLVAGGAMGGNRVRVGPVLGEAFFELRHRVLASGDLGLDPLELAWPGLLRSRRLGLRSRFGLGHCGDWCCHFVTPPDVI